jgi:hypothetical protein
LALSGRTALCARHVTTYGGDWAVSNRIVCDLIHRRVEPPRLPAEERADWWVLLSSDVA